MRQSFGILDDLLNILSDILSTENEGLHSMVNFFLGKSLLQEFLKGTVPVVGPLLFLISVDDLPDRLTSFFKLLV